MAAINLLADLLAWREQGYSDVVLCPEAQLRKAGETASIDTFPERDVLNAIVGRERADELMARGGSIRGTLQGLPFSVQKLCFDTPSSVTVRLN